jgi:integral membrane sensor domain MASE1
MTSSCHRCLVLPTGLVPIRFQSNSFLVGLARFFLWICPKHTILCTLMNLTISVPSIKLCHILHTLSILTGPNIFHNICLSKMCWFFSVSSCRWGISQLPGRCHVTALSVPSVVLS